MKQEFWYELLPALVLPLQGFTLFWAVEMFHSQELSITEKLAWITSIEVVGSTVWINSAHEFTDAHDGSRSLEDFCWQAWVVAVSRLNTSEDIIKMLAHMKTHPGQKWDNPFTGFFLKPSSET